MFSIPCSQFNDFATILAKVVFPTPLIPVNKNALGDLSEIIEFLIVSAIISWPIKSSNT